MQRLCLQSQRSGGTGNCLNRRVPATHAKGSGPKQPARFKAKVTKDAKVERRLAIAQTRAKCIQETYFATLVAFASNLARDPLKSPPSEHPGRRACYLGAREPQVACCDPRTGSGPPEPSSRVAGGQSPGCLGGRSYVPPLRWSRRRTELSSSDICATQVSRSDLRIGALSGDPERDVTVRFRTRRDWTHRTEGDASSGVLRDRAEPGNLVHMLDRVDL